MLDGIHCIFEGEGMREGERERERQRKTDTDTYIVAQQEFIQIREKVLYHKGMTQKHVHCKP